MRILESHVQTVTDRDGAEISEPQVTIVIEVADHTEGVQLLQDINLMVNPPDGPSRPESPESE